MIDLQIIFIIVAIIVTMMIVLRYAPVMLWYKAKISGLRVGLEELVLKMRGSNVDAIVKGLIASANGGVVIDKKELEAFSLAGGNLQNVINGMIAAKAAGLNLSFKNASKADFIGIDLVGAIREKKLETIETLNQSSRQAPK